MKLAAQRHRRHGPIPAWDPGAWTRTRGRNPATPGWGVRAHAHGASDELRRLNRKIDQLTAIVREGVLADRQTAANTQKTARNTDRRFDRLAGEAA